MASSPTFSAASGSCCSAWSLFSTGSMLSGTAQSMGQLIAMRTIQGLGAGAVAPIVLTLLGDLFTLEERARIQGLFSTVWGLSSIAGPLIGGWLTVHLNWRWVFFVGVPFSIVALLMIAWCLHERVERRTVAPIDWAGAGLLTGRPFRAAAYRAGRLEPGHDARCRSGGADGRRS